MHKFDMWIIYGTGGLLLIIVGTRFVLHEIRGLVREYRELKAEIRAPLPPVQQPVVVAETRSKNVPGLTVRGNAG